MTVTEVTIDLLQIVIFWSTDLHYALDTLAQVHVHIWKALSIHVLQHIQLKGVAEVTNVKRRLSKLRLLTRIIYFFFFK